MKIVSSVGDMQELSRRARRDGRQIGFVPTMGSLHEGHLSLMRLVKSISDWRVVSLFVNPLQFGAGEDFSRYPRDRARDEALCRKEGMDILFCPSVEEMYPAGHGVYVDESDLSSGLCGAHRPGHFRGVITVVAKLFNIVLPDVAVFGQKDAQQSRLIEQLVRDLNFPIDVVVAPIVREADGLAMSSRNVYLSNEERRQAAGLCRALALAERRCAAGERDAAVICADMRAAMTESMPKAVIDYVEAVDYRTLKPVDRIGEATLVAVAVRLGTTRLIDNTIIRCTAT